jgi:hypothetical protein
LSNTEKEKKIGKPGSSDEPCVSGNFETLNTNFTNPIPTAEQFLASKEQFPSFMSALAASFYLITELEAPFGEVFSVLAPD